MPDIRIYQTLALAARALADQIVQISENAIGARGRFTLALSGGSTPRTLYELLATREYGDRIDWPSCHIFFGDERCVPPEHDDSNYGMARKALLQHIPVPTSQVYHMRGDWEPQAAADDYERALREWFTRRGERLPRFDVCLLGLGEDGHTASLFPDTPALTETERWVVANPVEKLDAWRLTLTPKALNAASRVYFLVSGENKAEMVWRATNPPEDAIEAPPLPGMRPANEFLPVHLIQPTQGEVRWYVDQAAGRLVSSSSLEWLAQQRGGPGVD